MLARKKDNSCRFSFFARSILGGIVLLDNLIRNVVRGFYYIEKINFEMHTNTYMREMVLDNFAFTLGTLAQNVARIL